MSSDNYQVQNVYEYSRKSYKKNRRGSQENNVNHQDDDVKSPRCDTRNVGYNIDASGHDCEETGDLANILHKKCPVITLAEQQLRRLLEETDVCLSDRRYCRLLCDIIRNRKAVLLLLILLVAFTSGLILGAASCGSYHGRFKSPILTFIDNFFILDAFPMVRNKFYSVF